ncbi:MAG: dienelactone hydrolase family protein [Cytophagales bacterium]|nr:dienelactone hydrolase family protein [Cytophagales bacterium]
MTTNRVVSFNYKARYACLGTLSPQTKNIVFALHGYGQLAPYFLKKFQPVCNDHTYLVAPEGLSHFYLEDVTSRSQTGNTKVGASWMTRENRLMDIENYLSYLHTVYHTEVPTGYNGKVTLLGFSQGAATASRWVCAGAHAHQLILWAGVFPPDLNLQDASTTLARTEVKFVYGTKDPFVTEARLHEVEHLFAKLNLSPDRITFEGGHELHTGTLTQLLAV